MDRKLCNNIYSNIFQAQVLYYLNFSALLLFVFAISDFVSTELQIAYIGPFRSIEYIQLYCSSLIVNDNAFNL